MYILITLFYIFLIGIAGMLFFKRREATSGQPSIVSRLGRRSDHLFSTVFSAVSRSFSYLNKHTFIALAQWVAFHILVRIRKVYVEVKHQAMSTPQGKKMIDAVRGKGEIKKGGASFYLRRISADER